MTKKAYGVMLNDVGDIFEALAAISNIDTHRSADIRKFLWISDVNAN